MGLIAGNMKLKTFVGAIGAVLGLGIVGMVGLIVSQAPTPLAPPEPLADEPELESAAVSRPGVTLNRPPDPVDTTGIAAARSPVTPAAQTSPANLRPVDREVLQWTTRSLSQAKAKDVSKGRPYKINVYQDVAGAGANRAKVDLDRDDRWDEKFTFEPDGGVSRQVAPADDENYTEVYRLTEVGWAPEG